jgi:PAS domain S-box-containing protein
MIAQSSTESQISGSNQDIFDAVARLKGSEYATLILDRTGRILSCGVPAERIFGADQVRLLGRKISEFIAGLFLNANSPSFGERYLGYLCSNREWRRFQAHDAGGQGFMVELNISRIASDGHEMFLLNVRRSEPAERP